MFDDEKLRVTLNIAGEQVKTVINRSDEEELRMLEKEVTSLFNRWRVADPSRTKSQVLAMVALKKENEKQRQLIEKLEMDKDFLQMARQIAPDREALDRSRAMIARLVRDVDKCIEQLKD